MEDNKQCECIIQIGKTNIGLIAPTPEYAEGIKDYFQITENIHKADIWLTLTIIAEKREIDLSQSLFETKKIDSHNFTMANGLVKGSFYPEKKKGFIQVHHVLTSDTRTRVFEQIFYQAFYSVSRLHKYDACLIHACGIIINNKGYLFTGKSGSGKSTIAQLSQNYTVLNDEICLLVFSPDGIHLSGTPFNGFFKNKKRGTAALETVFILSQADEHRIEPVRAGRAIQTIVSEIVPPIGLEDNMTARTKQAMVDITCRLVSKCPAKILHFLPNPEFWKEIL